MVNDHKNTGTPGIGIYSTATRVAGISALAFAAGVIVANLSVAGAPMADATAAEAESWYLENSWRMILANSMVALTFPAILAFGAAMYELARDQAAARLWMLLGAFGAVSMVGVFSILVAGNISSVLFADNGGDLFALAWTIHNAAFAINMTILGTAFFGFSMGAYSAGLTPSWLRTVGLTGATLLLITGFGNTIVAGGSPVAFVGFAGFILWMIWLVTTGFKLMRRPAVQRLS